MSTITDLSPSLALSTEIGEAAADEGLSTNTALRFLRSIIRRGRAQAVAKFLLEEEQRLGNERVRKEETAEEWRRRAGR